MGYCGEQNGQSGLLVAAGYRLLQDENRTVWVGVRFVPLASASTNRIDFRPGEIGVQPASETPTIDG
jgi:hypothetical protein